MITRSRYISGSENLHDEYWQQFATSETSEFVRTRIGLDRLRKSKDKYFNDVGFKFSRRGAGIWVWDSAPCDIVKMRLAGECGENDGPSLSARTCVAKSCARLMLTE